VANAQRGKNSMTQRAFEWRGRNCVVTGAGGFIGTALCRELSARGARVHGWGRRRPDDLTVTDWHDCDVTDRARVRQLFTTLRPDFVFHLASRVTGSRSLDLVLPILNDNLLGTVHVLTAAVEHGSPHVTCLGSLQEPDMELRKAPGSPYGAAKFAASAYARMFAEAFALPITIARPFMVYGPGQLDLTKLVPYVCTQILKGERASLSSGRQSFDWVYVDDVVDALLSGATEPAAVGKTVDIGCGVLTSVGEVATGVAARLGRPEALQLGAIADRGLEQTRCSDVEATARLIGWRPRVDLAAGLDRTVEWYRKRFATAAS
jgi:nucleoside-diphosphate-sugar epimerase